MKYIYFTSKLQILGISITIYIITYCIGKKCISRVGRKKINLYLLSLNYWWQF